MLFLMLVACAGSSAPEPPPPAPPQEQVAPAAEDFPGSQVYLPPSGMPTAAIVVLHGSEGGRAPYAPALAQALAEQGLVAAAFCWFGCEGLPDAVHRVPLDRTEAYARHLAEGPASGLPIVLYGASRGAEHALLLASLLGDTTVIQGVASHAGSDTVVASFDPATNRPRLTDGGYDAAWTWRGEALFGERAMPFGSGPAVDIAAFPGPVLLSHGERDPLWPAERSRRLEHARSSQPELRTEAHYWPGEGHILQSPAHVQAFVEALVTFTRSVPPP